jgi:hypothetical protein
MFHNVFPSTQKAKGIAALAQLKSESFVVLFFRCKVKFTAIDLRLLTEKLTP